MTFAEAAEQLAAGKRVRRAAWRRPLVMLVLDGSGWLREYDGGWKLEPWVAHIDDLTATDWEVEG